jgi:hypothetical protein
MGARRGAPPRDPDDWFDDSEPIPPQRPSRSPEQIDPEAKTREQAVRPTDDWLAPEPLPPTRRSAPVGNRRLLVAVGIALALLLIGLAAGGVFTSGSSKKTSPPPTRHTVQTTTQTPTQTLAVPAATLKLGDRGTAVKELQRALRSLGYTVGSIDGDFGASTANALIAFQTAHHLKPDGILGPASRAALRNAQPPG